MRDLFTILFILFFGNSFIPAQSILNFDAQSDLKLPAINTGFNDYRLLTVDIQDVYNQSTQEGKLSIFNEGKLLEFNLVEHNLLAENYFAIIKDENGITVKKDFSVRTYTGYLEGKTGFITLTIDQNYFLAMCEVGNELFFIEQMDDEAKSGLGNQLILYKANDVKINSTFSCGVTDFEDKQDEINLQLELRANLCKVVELAIASDATMYTKYSSNATLVMNHNIGVMNNVAFNYRHEFTDNIEFSIVTQYVSTTFNNDPLLPNTASTDANVVLPNFLGWGNQVGGPWSSVTFDLAQFWTNRDFDGSTVGLAYLTVVCTNFRYHILQDFTNDAQSLRVMTAHEIGHNFGSGHDASGSPYIMAPAVTVTDTWSPASKTVINTHINSRLCLGSCTNPITANFVYAPSAICNSGDVTFKDKSSNSSVRSWTFTGGSPASSSDQQPVVNYSSNGTYGAHMAVNGGNATLEITNAVTVTSAPTFNFGSCPTPGGTPQDLGPQFIQLSDLSYTSGVASADGAIYQDRTCLGIALIQPSTQYTFGMVIGAGSENFEVFDVYIDYNNNGVFAASELIGDSGNQAYIGYISFNFTTPATLPENQLLRLRVVTDYYFNPISGPCYQPVRGQVEDYSVLYKDFNVILPVTIVDFNGYSQNGLNKLEWYTADEKNIKEYIVESSLDGVNYQPIGMVKSNFQNEKNQYSFLDDRHTAPIRYYRLKIVGIEGISSFSNVISIAGKNQLILGNISTSISDVLHLELINPENSAIDISLYNMHGYLVVKDQLTLSSGTHDLNYDMSQLSSGMYILHVKSSNGDFIVEKCLKH